jgi:hypothetical protein
MTEYIQTRPRLRAVDEIAGELAAAVDRLPFAGNDQRSRAREMVTKLRHELQTIQLAEGRTSGPWAGRETTDAPDDLERR